MEMSEFLTTDGQALTVHGIVDRPIAAKPEGRLLTKAELAELAKFESLKAERAANRVYGVDHPPLPKLFTHPNPVVNAIAEWLYYKALI